MERARGEWVLSISAIAWWSSLPLQMAGQPTFVFATQRCFATSVKFPSFHILTREVTVTFPQEEVSWKAFILKGFSTQLRNKEAFCVILRCTKCS
jgi:hypothetical protein